MIVFVKNGALSITSIKINFNKNRRRKVNTQYMALVLLEKVVSFYTVSYFILTLE
jgi:hypothetical protein